MNEDKLSLEDRTRIIGFHESEPKVYGLIDNSFPDRKIKYRVREVIFDSKDPSGSLDIAFVCNFGRDVRIIEAMFLVNGKGEALGDQLIHYSIQALDAPLCVLNEHLYNLELLKDHTKNLAFDYSRSCYDKIMELHKLFLERVLEANK